MSLDSPPNRPAQTDTPLYRIGGKAQARPSAPDDSRQSGKNTDVRNTREVTPEGEVVVEVTIGSHARAPIVAGQESERTPDPSDDLVRKCVRGVMDEIGQEELRQAPDQEKVLQLLKALINNVKELALQASNHR